MLIHVSRMHFSPDPQTYCDDHTSQQSGNRPEPKLWNIVKDGSQQNKDHNSGANAAANRNLRTVDSHDSGCRGLGYRCRPRPVGSLFKSHDSKKNTAKNCSEKNGPDVGKRNRGRGALSRRMPSNSRAASTKYDDY